MGGGILPVFRGAQEHFAAYQQQHAADPMGPGPDYIVLYQKNIEAVCSGEAGVREQIRLTVIHELGHYFGMDENQLKNV